MAVRLKPKLNIAQQLNLLESRGVTFHHKSKEDAIESLSRTNNYFKLTAYRKNFATDSQGRYLDLDFAYLKDLSKIDMHLRYCLLLMCLDVEHFVKAKLMAFITQSDEDGYAIVQEHRNASVYAPDKSQPEKTIQPYDDIYRKAKRNEYCCDLYHKHKDNMPIWALIEIIQFGTLVSLYKFIAEKHEEKEMISESFIMMDINKIRNAAAHNNCILNDLSKTWKYKADYGLLRELSRFMSKDVYDSKLANPRVLQMTSLLYLHQTLVTSGLHQVQAGRLRFVVDVMYRNADYYKNNPRLQSIFEYFRKLVDNWF